MHSNGRYWRIFTAHAVPFTVFLVGFLVLCRWGPPYVRFVYNLFACQNTLEYQKLHCCVDDVLRWAWLFT